MEVEIPIVLLSAGEGGSAEGGVANSVEWNTMQMWCLMHIFNLRIHKYNSPGFELHIMLLLCSVSTWGGSL